MPTYPKTMGCQIHSLNPQLLHKKQPFTTKSIHSCPYFSLQPNLKFHKKTLFTLHSNLDKQQTVSTVDVNETGEIPKFDAYNVKFKTLGACKLGISRYPDLEYNAQGGEGSGKLGTKILDNEGLNGEVSVDFDVKTLYIPPLLTATTKFLGLPLPPLLKIDIVPEVFNGKINQQSGKVDLNFTAKFYFSIGNIYKAPPLVVETVLTSEESKGKIKKGRGERLNKDGICRLVGVATVDPINDLFLNAFLSLPTECIAILNATISFINTNE